MFSLFECGCICIQAAAVLGKFTALNFRTSRSPTPTRGGSGGSGSSSRSSTPGLDVSGSIPVIDSSSIDDGTSRSSTPARGRPDATKPAVRSNSPSPTAILREAAKHPLYPKQPIQTNQQLYEWFSQVERDVVHSQEAKFRDYLNKVSGHMNTCDELMTTIDSVEEDVINMLGWWRQVEEGGKSMQDACQLLLAERVSYLSLLMFLTSFIEYI